MHVAVAPFFSFSFYKPPSPFIAPDSIVGRRGPYQSSFKDEKIVLPVLPPSPHTIKQSQQRRPPQKATTNPQFINIKKQKKKLIQIEEMMMITTTSTITSADSRNQTSTEKQEQITTSTCLSWKLYQNPFYISQDRPKSHLLQHKFAANSKHIRRLHLQPCARRIAAPFWDLSFYRPAIMGSEIDNSRAVEVVDLKADLEFERRVRKKMESLNKRMTKELAEERRAREAVERVCDQLAREISEHRAEMEKMKREIEEEREMLRVAEVLREERVQMKLAEAKLFYEEKLVELEQLNKRDTLSRNDKLLDSEEDLKSQDNSSRDMPTCDGIDSSDGGDTTCVSANYSYNDHNGSSSSCCNSNGFPVQRKASPDPENPHIRRGIKGFIEFPRAVKAIGSRNTSISSSSSSSNRARDVGTKLECQKAQLRILLKQRAPYHPNNLIIG